jgi:NAD(P)H-nitrite reductase large subunit
MEHVVIIGNGISGVTAARHIRKMSDHKITIISSETEYFFSRTALMYVYMGHMKFDHIKPYEDWFWKKNRIDLVQDFVVNIDFVNKELSLQNGNPISYDKLILATGSKPNKFGWPGQDLEGVQGLYSYQDLQSMEKYSHDLKRAVIVGGGLIGIEMAEMFLSRNIPVTFLVRESSFWNNVLPPGESEVINRHILEHGVDLRLGEELKAILPDDNGRCRAVITKNQEKIDCEFVGLTAGVSPNISFLRNSDLETDRGILVNEFLQTNIDDM